jgi:alkylation response protein AidB-like acyl-CoA dehydrogenase
LLPAALLAPGLALSAACGGSGGSPAQTAADAAPLDGSDWFISGAPDARWNNAALKAELGKVTGADFEVVRLDGLVTP